MIFQPLGGLTLIAKGCPGLTFRRLGFVRFQEPAIAPNHPPDLDPASRGPLL